MYYIGKLPGNVFTSIYYTMIMDCISYIVTCLLIKKVKRSIFMAIMISIACVGCFAGSVVASIPDFNYLVRSEFTRICHICEDQLHF